MKFWKIRTDFNRISNVIFSESLEELDNGIISWNWFFLNVWCNEVRGECQFKCYRNEKIQVKKCSLCLRLFFYILEKAILSVFKTCCRLTFLIGQTL